MKERRIADYALLSDCHGSALVSRDGSVDWMCLPRFDARPVFARLLGKEAGHFSINVRGATRFERAYEEGTLVLTTRIVGPHGEAVLREALCLGSRERGHRLGADAPHALLREITCRRGEVDLEVELAPRAEFGRVPLTPIEMSGGLFAGGDDGELCLWTSCRFELVPGMARTAVHLRQGERLCFALCVAESFEEAWPWSAHEVRARLDDTASAWTSWSRMHEGYEGPWRSLVRHSGRVLQALTYQPTGAIVAAPTSSLPEKIGGVRNWDYRYCWVRDASLTLDALWVAACPDEAHRFFEFLTGAARDALRDEGRLQIMFGIKGEQELVERELPHLEGFRGSRPVREGNGAWDQRQLDIHGELWGAADRLRDRLDRLGAEGRAFLFEVADAAARDWKLPDHGIWEVRGEARHFVYSKLMCWVALDRAVRLAGKWGARDRIDDWAVARDEVRRAILTDGYSERAGAFTQAFGSEALDASSLVIPITGFLPASDPRVRSTILAIEAGLTDPRGLVYRYRGEDGLPGDEGSFLLCSFWLAHALALIGEDTRARQLFERAAACANDVGLLAEEVEPSTGEALGNFPQALSHIGLVSAAWAISEAGAAPI